MTYTELKAYFENTELPKTIVDKWGVILDVKFLVDIHISTIETEIVRYEGKDIRKSTPAKNAKECLLFIHERMQDKTAWNLPLPTIENLRESKSRL
jgi:hypothetical protein